MELISSARCSSFSSIVLSLSLSLSSPLFVVLITLNVVVVVVDQHRYVGRTPPPSPPLTSNCTPVSLHWPLSHSLFIQNHRPPHSSYPAAAIQSQAVEALFQFFSVKTFELIIKRQFAWTRVLLLFLLPLHQKSQSVRGEKKASALPEEEEEESEIKIAKKLCSLTAADTKFASSFWSSFLIFFSFIQTQLEKSLSDTQWCDLEHNSLSILGHRRQQKKTALGRHLHTQTQTKAEISRLQCPQGVSKAEKQEGMSDKSRAVFRKIERKSWAYRVSKLATTTSLPHKNSQHLFFAVGQLSGQEWWWCSA